MIEEAEYEAWRHVSGSMPLQPPGLDNPQDLVLCHDIRFEMIEPFNSVRLAVKQKAAMVA